MTARDFPIEDVVTITSDVMITDRGVQAVQAVLDHVLGDNVFTHQIPAAVGAAMPHIVAQHPWLTELDPPKGDIPALKAWIARTINDHGPTVALTPAVDAEWVPGRALQDLADMVGPDRVIGVVLPSKEDR